jgi:uncharacterized membrane protein YbjE (DUF340 family)
MLNILILMATGTVLGILLRKRQDLPRRLDRAMTWSIYLLLFLLGLSIGTDQDILLQLPELGYSALVISLGGIAGSVAVARFGWRLLSGKGKGKGS